jgi:hypothetical protein
VPVCVPDKAYIRRRLVVRQHPPGTGLTVQTAVFMRASSCFSTAQYRYILQQFAAIPDN